MKENKRVAGTQGIMKYMLHNRAGDLFLWCFEF